MYFLSPGWQWSKGLDSPGESALLKAFPAPTRISDAHTQDVWWLLGLYGGGRENFSLAPTGYGFWAVAGLRSENNCILSRWSQLLCDYYFSLLRCVSAERILVLIDEGFLSDPEIQLTSQLKPQWELPWSVWGLIPALFQVSGFSLTVLSLEQASALSCWPRGHIHRRQMVPGSLLVKWKCF